MIVRVDDDMMQDPFDMTVEQFDAALEQFALGMDDLDCSEIVDNDWQDCPW